MFSSFYFDTGKSAWQMRPWGDGKDLWWTASDGLVVELDLIGDGDITFFDCVYGILNSQNAEFQNLAIRCKEFTEAASGESKVADNTVVYGITDGRFKARRVTDNSEAVRLTQQICKPTMRSFLCRLPADKSVYRAERVQIAGRVRGVRKYCLEYFSLPCRNRLICRQTAQETPHSWLADLLCQANGFRIVCHASRLKSAVRNSIDYRVVSDL